MLLALYSGVIVLLDLLSLQVKIWWSLLVAVFRLIVPKRMKSLKGENVLVTALALIYNLVIITR